MRKFISHNNIIWDNNEVCGERSLWWNLKHNDKPLALLQGCSARVWASKGLANFSDIIKDGHLLSWNEVMQIYDIPISHSKAYNVLKDARAPLALPKQRFVESSRFVSFM